MSLVLDCGCGSGERSIALAKDGFLVLGTDTSEPTLRAARVAASGLPRPPEFICRSVADLPDGRRLFGRPFDAVLLFDDALSAIGHPVQLQRHIADASEQTRRGGLYVLQQVNYDAIPVDGAVEFPELSLPDGSIVRKRHRRIDNETASVEIDRIGADGSSAIAAHPLRIWPPSVLTDLLSRSGWRVVRSAERLDGGVFDASRSRECAIIAERL